MAKFQLPGKVAIITGGGTGIGAAIAHEYVAAGAKVVLASRKQENLDKVVAEIKAAGGEALAVVTDVRIPEQVDNAVKQAVDTFGRLDIMVNNSGASFMIKTEELTPNGWDVIVNINLKGVFLFSVAAAKVMIPQKSGRVINISSTAGLAGSPRMAHYGAAKAGVINFTRTCAVEWAEHNITVNCIAPGMIETEGVRAQEVLTGEVDTSLPALRRPGAVEDISTLALFLASEEAGHISGETYPVRGISAG